VSQDSALQRLEPPPHFNQVHDISIKNNEDGEWCSEHLISKAGSKPNLAWSRSNYIDKLFNRVVARK